MIKKHTKGQFLFIIMGAFFLTCCFFGSSYALNNKVSETEEYNYFGTEDLELSYVDYGTGNGDMLSLTNKKPTTDTKAIKENGYRFSITNISTKEKKYRIMLVEDISMIEEDECEEKQLYFGHVRFQFDNNKPKYLKELENTGYVLYESEETILPGNSEIHELKLWFDENTPKNALSKHYHGRIVLEDITAEKEYKTYTKGEILQLSESKYLILENSESNTNYLKLLPLEVLSYKGMQCSNEDCYLATKDMISEVHENFRIQIQSQIGKNVDLTTVRIRNLEKSELVNYSLELSQYFSSEKNYWIYDSDTASLLSNLGTSNEESNYIRPVIILDKRLLEEQE